MMYTVLSNFFLFIVFGSDKLTTTNPALNRHEILNKNRFAKQISNTTDSVKRGEMEQLKTKILQLELKLYRREKLVEILVEKLKQVDHSFNLATDPGLIAYLDDNWSVLAIDCYGRESSSRDSGKVLILQNYE